MLNSSIYIFISFPVICQTLFVHYCLFFCFCGGGGGKIKKKKCGVDLVIGFDAILTSRQTRGKLRCLYENLMSNNFRKTDVLKKECVVN